MNNQRKTANDIVTLLMDGMVEKQRGWIFCNDYAGTTALTKDAYQKRLTAKQVNWLVNVAAQEKNFTVSDRGNRSLEGWIGNRHWYVFIIKNGSGMLTVKDF